MSGRNSGHVSETVVTHLIRVEYEFEYQVRAGRFGFGVRILVAG